MNRQLAAFRSNSPWCKWRFHAHVTQTGDGSLTGVATRRNSRDRGDHLVNERPQRAEQGPKRNARPWRVPGVPTPKRLRIQRPRLNALACTSNRFSTFSWPRRFARRSPPVSYRCAQGRSSNSPRLRSRRLPRAPWMRRRLAYTASHVRHGSRTMELSACAAVIGIHEP